MRKQRAIFLSAIAALAMTGGLAACGGDDQASIAAKIDEGNAGAETFPDSATGAAAKEQQENADADAAAAQRALERREELAELERTQQEETERLMREGSPGGNVEDSEIPIGSADPAAQDFRARLSGVCAGGQKRIIAVSKDAEEAAKSKDPMKILEAAQGYTLALNDFMGALSALNPPQSMRADYRSWLNTINALADNARLQVVSYADPKKSAELGAKTQRLFEQLVVKSATLGVTCLSSTV